MTRDSWLKQLDPPLLWAHVKDAGIGAPLANNRRRSKQTSWCLRCSCEAWWNCDAFMFVLHVQFHWRICLLSRDCWSFWYLEMCDIANSIINGTNSLQLFDVESDTCLVWELLLLPSNAQLLQTSPLWGCQMAILAMNQFQLFECLPLFLPQESWWVRFRGFSRQ